MNEKLVTLSDNSTILVKRIALGKFGELVLALEGALKKFTNGAYGDIGSMTNNDFVGMIPQLLADATPEVIKVLSVVTDVPQEQLATLGVDDATELLVAVFETNNFEKIFANIKKLMAFRVAKAPESPSITTNGSSEPSTSSPTNTAGAGPTS